VELNEAIQEAEEAVFQMSESADDSETITAVDQTIDTEGSISTEGKEEEENTNEVSHAPYVAIRRPTSLQFGQTHRVSS
jgi:hypothetical protein